MASLQLIPYSDAEQPMGFESQMEDAVMAPPPALRRGFFTRRVVLASAALASAALVVGTISVRGARGAPLQATSVPATRAVTQLFAMPKECAAYKDCAALEGNCCPNDNNASLGCCNSPLVNATLAREKAIAECVDTPDWTNGYTACGSHGFTEEQGCIDTGVTCSGYVHFGWCKNNAPVKGKEWAFSSKFNDPALNCCACGKGQSDFSMAKVANNTQGEPSEADCAASPCGDLGMSGHCCPTDDGTMLGCCGGLAAPGEEPPLLPPAKTPGPLMTFYMFRVADSQDYTLDGANMANLAGDLWYLHNEVVKSCPRKFNVERLVRFKVTMRATPELFGQGGRNFDSFVAMDQAKCTVPSCAERHWDRFGYVVGCQPNSVTQVALPGTPTWYSLPGTCPSRFYFEKDASCKASEPGGACPTSEVTGTRNCTYYFEKAGEISLDELSGIQDYNTVCSTTGQLEYDIFTDRGVGTSFWDSKLDLEAGQRRLQAIVDLFEKKFPGSVDNVYYPTCTP
eukprot:CAMPEP_0197874898 /NCGR_PEP_ID=MMETSP1439-20131203/4280_1 /TAXON_ID=66791 /ORGANISM="Gonyaulax spinifera, Strain CCMP409" /LENGTH=511 /DNA_ID=CAMNT_0043494063 /DNA_START=48 /DNA_END=1583 /DNA_ORIENTATION=-